MCMHGVKSEPSSHSQVAGLLPYLILTGILIKFPMVIFVRPRPGDQMKIYQPTVDVGISWYEHEVTTKINHSFNALYAL